MLFAVLASVAIAAGCFCLSNPYTGLMGCATFAILGGFIAYFHTVGLVLLNFMLATLCAAIRAHQLLVASGDVALVSAALVTVMTFNVGIPFGILSLMHVLRNDLRNTDRDSLTSLHNRRSLYTAVCEQMALRAGSPASYLVTAVIDLDHFKQINDTQGHAVGDQALIAVGKALQQNCRPTAIAARVGGEEFVIVDIDTTPRPAQMTERLRRAIASTPFQLTASIGTSGVALDELPTIPDRQLIDDLIRASDTAMYEAKRAGGNRVCHSGPSVVRRAD